MNKGLTMWMFSSDESLQSQSLSLAGFQAVDCLRVVTFQWQAFNLFHGIFEFAGLYYFIFHRMKDNSKGYVKVYYSKDNQRIIETMAKTDASPMYSLSQ